MRHQLGICSLLILFTCKIALGEFTNDLENLEPFNLTESQAHEVLKIKTEDLAPNLFTLNGIQISARNFNGRKQRGNLDVLVDPRLNLWNGLKGDMRGSHLGSLELVVDVVENSNGENILDTTNDKPWAATIKVYDTENGLFGGGRSVTFNQSDENATVTSISGQLRLLLPINMQKYTISKSADETTPDITKRDDVSAVSIKDKGVTFRHPQSEPNFKPSIMTYDANGKRIMITSQSSPRENVTSHAYRISNSVDWDSMLIFLPERYLEISIPFKMKIE